MRNAILSIVVMAAACGSSASKATDARMIDGAGPDTNLAAACQAIEDRFDAALAAGAGHCAIDADCAVLGGQDLQWACDGHPSLGRCEGNPIEKDAPGYADALAADRDFWNTCSDSDFQRIFDCAPFGGATCNANGRCVGTVVGSCFPPMPDAGAPDAGS